jgi:pimeloyl-ACP methyl ester carboxylesterase
VAARRAEPPDTPSAGAAAAAPASAGSSRDQGRIVRFRSQDGLNLAARIFDAAPGERLPLLCLPGLSRNSRDFIRLGQHVSQHPDQPRKVVALDYRGRGLSDADLNWRNYTPVVEAQDVMAAATALGVERAVVVGASRGGIIAMLLGALRPTLLAGVVLIDIGPVVEATGLARIKTYLANRPVVRSWEEAEALARQVAEKQFPTLAAEEWRAYVEAWFVETPRGLVPQFDPQLLRTLEGIDFAEKIPALWPQFMSLARVPVLAIRGELSDILSERTLAEMAERHPDFEHLTVPDQGHSPLLRDEPALERIRAFASRCESGA